ncbi:hypothetical protein CWN83_22780 [Vibrio splendidus]|nr:hypothetical protein CWN83_22780 [Vibrio splendidus]
MNIVIPPISLDGTSISIRKFREQNIGFEDLIGFGSMSPDMARVLMIASRCRINVLISGGTGSGKTTLLNALSQYIAEDERIVTIEDAAELRLQQPNLVRLETRTSSVEQTGAVTQRELVINALRMRPDRIILGECRGSEAFEMLQAMNTGHDGSMSTLHANTPRDAIARVESMVMMANLNQPLDAIRRTIVARLEDGSRVNIVIPPISLDGTSISIRKFREQNIGFEDLIGFGSMSPDMARVLMIASRCRINVLISGGTGSGKTTLLNALSQYIAEDERIVTIEDAAELRLQQPNLVRLETRTSSVEQTGAVTQRELVINALRMRPDRIILGECRGSEAFEMLQAMNTGHDGSMSTLHANTPRDAIARVESMVMMANLNQPLDAIRRTIVSAVQMIVQVNRLRDGSRKITSISEIVGLEGDSVVMEEIYRFRYDDAHYGETVKGEFVTDGIMQRSELVKKAQFFGLYEELKASFKGA